MLIKEIIIITKRSGKKKKKNIQLNVHIIIGLSLRLMREVSTLYVINYVSRFNFEKDTNNIGRFI
jgi:hypothetical protein